jgi:hypothetical protein
MYKFELKTNEKVFLITMSGLVSKEDGEKCLTDLQRKLKTFNTSEYYLVVDTQELKASTQDSGDNIKNTIELFVKTPFKERYNILPKSVITNLQAKRFTGNDMFSKITPVKSYEEIFSNKKKVAQGINHMFNCG